MKKKNSLSDIKKALRIKLMAGVVMCSVVMVQPVMAQLDSRDDFKVGIKAGANVSNVWDQRGDDFRADSKLGFAGGVWLGIPIGTYLGFQPEVLLSQKGFRADGTLLGSEYTFRRTTTHLDIPLQLQLKPAKFLTIVGGPQYSFLLNESNKYTFGSNSVEQQEQFDSVNIRRNMFGFVFGFDVIVQQFVFASRVGWDVLDNHGDGSSSTPRYKNRWIQFTAGIQF